MYFLLGLQSISIIHHIRIRFQHFRHVAGIAVKLNVGVERVLVSGKTPHIIHAWTLIWHVSAYCAIVFQHVIAIRILAHVNIAVHQRHISLYHISVDGAGFDVVVSLVIICLIRCGLSGAFSCTGIAGIIEIASFLSICIIQLLFSHLVSAAILVRIYI